MSTSRPAAKPEFPQTNLQESEEYRAKREELRLAEIESLEAREHVAALRRQLPQGPVVQDYPFLEGPVDLNDGDEPVREVRLSELFTAPNRSLFIYHMMFGKKHKGPCPMCTLTVDGLNGVAHHIRQNLDLAVVVATDPKSFRAHARRQGWNNIRLLSAPESSTFKYDLRSEDREGNQDSNVSVFTRDPDGQVRHFYSVHPSLAPDIQERGQDLLDPVYNVLDLTPQGRGNWYATLDYRPNLMSKRNV